MVCLYTRMVLSLALALAFCALTMAGSQALAGPPLWKRVYSLRDKCSSFSTWGSRLGLDGFVSKIASRKALQDLVRVTRYEVYP